ncbi:hypothetical protein UT300007_02960 [Clostridium sp. CTA-7]
MVGFDVREMELNDYNDINKLNSKIDYSKVKYILEDRNHLMIVAQLNDDVIGYISSNLNEDIKANKVVGIEDIIVDEKYRGLGVGHQLMLELEKSKKSKGANYIISSNKNCNEEEIKFYKRQGFTLDNDFKFIKNTNLQ